MKKKKLAMIMVLSVLLTAIFTGCSQTAAKSGTLRVGVRDDIMNLGYHSEVTGKYYGLEIDLANALAAEMGYKDVEFTPVQPETRKDTLLNGDVDCLIAAYTIADSRLENFDFSAPYYTDTLKVMVETSTTFTNIEELKNKKIGVLSGSSAGPQIVERMQELGLLPGADEEVPEENIGFEVVKIDSYEELNTALEEGTIDAVCMDGCIAQTYLTDSRRFLDVEFTEQQYGVATQKDSELSSAVAAAVDKLLEDGTIDKLVDKWN
ncbi:MAG: transporter substrate-binding domain-containing protein [Lachnospiraceae bacterium]|nr:transporter substrate-binding domain-containing protein [Lachnospiraceae bacterium]